MPDIAGTSVALTVVFISIVLSGICLGFGRAFGYRRLERFGLEELGQAVINAAVVGAAVGLLALISSTTSSFSSTLCADGSPINELNCTLQNSTTQTFELYNQTVQTSELLGYYQTLNLHFGSFSIQPFYHLDPVLSTLSNNTDQLNGLLILGYLQLALAGFIQQNAVAYLLSAGLVFRSFFATRKLGAFLLALFIGLYLFYPLIVLLFPFPGPDIQSALEELKGLNNNPVYATPSIVDLNSDMGIANKLDAMRFNATNSTNSSDLTGDVALTVQSNTRALARLWLQLAIAPLLALLVVGVLVRELAHALSAEIGFAAQAI